MDIANFLNSKDVASYLTSIQYNFSPLEVAHLIWRSKKTIEEKQGALNALTEEMPDCEIIYGEYYRKSIKDFIREHIALQNRYIEQFFGENKAIYEIMCDDYNGIAQSDCSFSKLKDCFESVNEIENETKIKYSSIQVMKKWLNINKYISLTFDRNKGIHHIQSMDTEDKRHKLFNIFDDTYAYLNLPTPFKRGDILVSTNSYFGKEPFVFFGFESCGERRPVCINVFDQASVELGTRWDNAIDYEYFDGRLEDRDILLRYVSKLYKGEISEKKFKEIKKLAEKGELDFEE